jgi:phosphoheptose isomerase
MRAIADVMIGRPKSGGKIMIAGNGGSAADA